MATTLASLASLTLTAQLASPINVGGSAVASLSKSYGSAFTDGAGAGQANRVYWATRTLALSASEDLDLAGTLTDAYGTVITFARIKALAIAADPANTNNVVVGNAASNGLAGLFGGLTHTAIVRPGAAVSWLCGPVDATGYVVTAGTGDLLHIANSGAGTSINYDVFVLGSAT